MSMDREQKTFARAQHLASAFVRVEPVLTDLANMAWLLERATDDVIAGSKANRAPISVEELEPLEFGILHLRQMIETALRDWREDFEVPSAPVTQE